MTHPAPQALCLGVGVCLLLLATGCATPEPSIPSHSAPRVVGTLDRAAVECLDWAWSISGVRELAGGVVREGDYFTCSPLTLGTRGGVTFYQQRHWLASFHTHTYADHMSRDKMSYQDREGVRTNPLGIPGYMRDSRGAVWVYKCSYPDTGRVVRQVCGERRVR